MKYKLTETTKEVNSITLYQIQALKDFGDVKKGDLGGWIEKEDNLSQEGQCWISGDARVFGNAVVSGDAWVFGNAVVSGNARVFGNARVSGNAEVSGNAWVFGNAVVSGNARVFDDIEVLSGDIEEVVIKGVRYKKVTETKTT